MSSSAPALPSEGLEYRKGPCLCFRLSLCEPWHTSADNEATWLDSIKFSDWSQPSDFLHTFQRLCHTRKQFSGSLFSTVVALLSVSSIDSKWDIFCYWIMKMSSHWPKSGSYGCCSINGIWFGDKHTFTVSAVWEGELSLCKIHFLGQRFGLYLRRCCLNVP
jgi:hypothetical protein